MKASVIQTIRLMKFTTIFAIFFLFLVCPAAGNNESCIQCHTDESILKSLVAIPKIKSHAGVGPAGPPAVVVPETYYKRYLIDKNILDKDPHFINECSFCHKGDKKSTEQEKAHKGVIKKPSADLKICGDCHSDITETYQSASHYTVQEMFKKVSRRFSKKEEKIFAEKVFGQSCKSCHASCGDCHVRSPLKDGISAGFMNGHGFVKKDEGKTCAVCHGGRVYPEYTGKHGGSPDVHFQKGMTCVDCHKKRHLHGGTDVVKTKEKTVENRPKCADCHKLGKETKATARIAHARHEGRVSCYGCHSQGEYYNCYNCHIGKNATSKSGFFLGVNPEDKKTLTTLRAIPVDRETFLGSGIKMENFDEVPDYRATSVHTIQKSTERTRSCDTCHVKRKGFLSKESLIKNGSKANEGLIFKMRSLSIQ
jgi:thiosulfate/3-mercaptopyruvate sulfurtransferase